MKKLTFGETVLVLSSPKIIFINGVSMNPDDKEKLICDILADRVSVSQIDSKFHSVVELIVNEKEMV